MRPDLAFLPIGGASSSASELDGGAVNLGHMELLIHYSLVVSVPELDDDLDASATKLVLKTTLDAPWLLHEVLAISARHLAVLNPRKSAFYLTQAVQLQTKAIEMFNSARLQINESNCIAAVLFSSTLGRHMLTDTLANRDPNVDLFLERYSQYVEVHRGLRAVAHGSWQSLVESELGPLLSWGIQKFDAKAARGNQFDGLRDWISQSSLDQAYIEACLDAIFFLQVGLDSVSGAATRMKRHQMVSIWSVLSPPKFTELVRQRQSEALIVLGHYAVLLHYARDMWQIGDAGAYFLHMVCEILGADSDLYLSWPRSIIFASGGADKDSS